LPGLTCPSERIRTRARHQAITETERALRSKLQGEDAAPNIILQAHLRLPLGENAEEATTSLVPRMPPSLSASIRRAIFSNPALLALPLNLDLVCTLEVCFLLRAGITGSS
jgi:hypothetical protein